MHKAAFRQDASTSSMLSDVQKLVFGLLSDQSFAVKNELRYKERVTYGAMMERGGHEACDVGDSSVSTARPVGGCC